MMEDKRDRLEFDGEVVDDSNGKFRVKISETQTVLCTLSGKIRQNSIRILLGDLVRIEVSEYSPELGRIKSRLKKP